MIISVGTRWTCVGQLSAVAALLLGKRDPGTYQREGCVRTRVHCRCFREGRYLLTLPRIKPFGSILTELT
jgi:hypothetical protein